MVMVVIGLELLHLLAVHAVASMDSLVNACSLDDLAANMGQMVTVVVASFDEHLVDPVDESFLSQCTTQIDNLLNKPKHRTIHENANKMFVPCGGIP